MVVFVLFFPRVICPYICFIVHNTLSNSQAQALDHDLVSQWGSGIDFPRDGLMPGRVGLELKYFENLAQLEVGICRQILQNLEWMRLRTAALGLEELLPLPPAEDTALGLGPLIWLCGLIPI